MYDKFIGEKVTAPGLAGDFIITGFTEIPKMIIAQLKRNSEDEVSFPVNFSILKKDNKYLEELLDKK